MAITGPGKSQFIPDDDENLSDEGGSGFVPDFTDPETREQIRPTRRQPPPSDDGPGSLPTQGGAPPPAPSPTPGGPPTPGQQYVIQEGESRASVAQQAYSDPSLYLALIQYLEGGVWQPGDTVSLPSEEELRAFAAQDPDLSQQLQTTLAQGPPPSAGGVPSAPPAEDLSLEEAGRRAQRFLQGPRGGIQQAPETPDELRAFLDELAQYRLAQQQKRELEAGGQAQGGSINPGLYDQITGQIEGPGGFERAVLRGPSGAPKRAFIPPDEVAERFGPPDIQTSGLSLYALSGEGEQGRGVGLATPVAGPLAASLLGSLTSYTEVDKESFAAALQEGGIEAAQEWILENLDKAFRPFLEERPWTLGFWEGFKGGVESLPPWMVSLPPWVLPVAAAGYAVTGYGMQFGTQVAKIVERLAFLTSIYTPVLREVDLDDPMTYPHHSQRYFAMLAEQNDLEEFDRLTTTEAERIAMRDAFEDFVTGGEPEEIGLLGINWNRLMGKFTANPLARWEEQMLGHYGITGLGVTWALDPDAYFEFIEDVENNPDMLLSEHVKAHENIWAETAFNTFTDPLVWLGVGVLAKGPQYAGRLATIERIAGRAVFPLGFGVEPLADEVFKIWSRSSLREGIFQASARSAFWVLSDDAADVIKQAALRAEALAPEGRPGRGIAGREFWQRAILEPDFLEPILSERQLQIWRGVADRLQEAGLMNIDELLDAQGALAKIPVEVDIDEVVEILGGVKGGDTVDVVGTYLEQAVDGVIADFLGLRFNPKGSLRRSVSWVASLLKENWLGPNPAYHAVNTVGDSLRMVMSGYYPTPYVKGASERVARYLGENFQLPLPRQVSRTLITDSLADYDIGQVDRTLSTEELPWPLGGVASFKALWRNLPTTGPFPEKLDNFLEGDNPAAWIIRNINYAKIVEKGLEFGTLMESSRRVSIFLQAFEDDFELRVRPLILQSLKQHPDIPRPVTAAFETGHLLGDADWQKIIRMYESGDVPVELATYSRPPTVPRNGFTDDVASELLDLEQQYMGRQNNPAYMDRVNRLFHRARKSAIQNAERMKHAIQQANELPEEFFARSEIMSRVYEKTGGTNLVELDDGGVAAFGDAARQLLNEDPMLKGVFQGGEWLIGRNAHGDLTLKAEELFGGSVADKIDLVPIQEAWDKYQWVDYLFMMGEHSPERVQQAAQRLLEIGRDGSSAIVVVSVDAPEELRTLASLAGLEAGEAPELLPAEFFLPEKLRRDFDPGARIDDERGFGIMFDPDYTKLQLSKAANGVIPDNVVFGELFENLTREQMVERAQGYLQRGPAGLKEAYEDAITIYNTLYYPEGGGIRIAQSIPSRAAEPKAYNVHALEGGMLDEPRTLTEHFSVENLRRFYFAGESNFDVRPIGIVDAETFDLHLGEGLIHDQLAGRAGIIGGGTRGDFFGLYLDNPRYDLKGNFLADMKPEQVTQANLGVFGADTELKMAQVAKKLLDEGMPPETILSSDEILNVEPVRTLEEWAEAAVDEDVPEWLQRLADDPDAFSRGGIRTGQNSVTSGKPLTERTRFQDAVINPGPEDLVPRRAIIVWDDEPTFVSVAGRKGPGHGEVIGKTREAIDRDDLLELANAWIHDEATIGIDGPSLEVWAETIDDARQAALRIIERGDLDPDLGVQLADDWAGKDPRIEVFDSLEEFIGKAEAIERFRDPGFQPGGPEGPPPEVEAGGTQVRRRTPQEVENVFDVINQKTIAARKELRDFLNAVKNPASEAADDFILVWDGETASLPVARTQNYSMHAPLKQSIGAPFVGGTIDGWLKHGRLTLAVPTSHEDVVELAQKLLDLGVPEGLPIQVRYVGIENPANPGKAVYDVQLRDLAADTGPQVGSKPHGELADQNLADWRRMRIQKIEEEKFMLLQGLEDWLKHVEEVASRNAGRLNLVQSERQKILDAIDEIRRQAIEEIDKAAVYGAMETNRVAFDYAVKSKPEEMLHYYSPFTTWQIRSPLLWAQIFSQRPGLVNSVYRLWHAMEEERERKNLTSRFEGTVGINLGEDNILGAPEGHYAVDLRGIGEMFGSFQQPWELPAEQQNVRQDALSRLIADIVNAGKWGSIRPWPFMDWALQFLDILPKEGIGEVFGPVQRAANIGLRAAGLKDVEPGTATGQFVFNVTVRRRISELEAEGVITHEESLRALAFEEGEAWELAQQQVSGVTDLTRVASLFLPFNIKYASPGEMTIRDLLGRGVSRESYPFLETYGLAFAGPEAAQRALIYEQFDDRINETLPGSPERAALFVERQEALEAGGFVPQSYISWRELYRSPGRIGMFTALAESSEGSSKERVLAQVNSLRPRPEQHLNEVGEVNWTSYFEDLEEFEKAIPSISSLYGFGVTAEQFKQYRNRFDSILETAYDVHRERINEGWEEYDRIQPGGESFGHAVSRYVIDEQQKAVKAGMLPDEAAAYALDLWQDAMARGLPFDEEQEYIAEWVESAEAEQYAAEVAQRMGLDWSDFVIRTMVRRSLSEAEFPGMFGAPDASDQILEYYFELTPREQDRVREVLNVGEGVNFAGWVGALEPERQVQTWNSIKARQLGAMGPATPSLVAGHILPPGDAMTAQEREELAQAERDFFLYNRAQEEGRQGTWTDMMDKYYGDPNSGSGRFWDTISKYALDIDAFEDPVIGGILDRAARGVFDLDDEAYNRATNYFLERIDRFTDPEKTQEMRDNPTWVEKAQDQRTSLSANRMSELEDLRAEYFNIYWRQRPEWEQENPEEWQRLRTYMSRQRAEEVGRPHYLYFFKEDEYEKWYNGLDPDELGQRPALLRARMLKALEDLRAWQNGSGAWTHEMSLFIGPPPAEIETSAEKAKQTDDGGGGSGSGGGGNGEEEETTPPPEDEPPPPPESPFGFLPGQNGQGFVS